MAFYIRKSISVGPLRFNLSKSGIGVSTGIKGLRIGTGPRGNYVHMGRGGLYYRATLPAVSQRPGNPYPSNHQDGSIPPTQPQVATHSPLQPLSPQSVEGIVDTSSKELIDEINEKRAKLRIWPWATGVSLIFLIWAFSAGFPTWLLLVQFAVSSVVVYMAYQRDELAKSVVLFYDFEPETEAVYDQFLQGGHTLRGVHGSWHIKASGQVYDRKYHAGAGHVIDRGGASIAIAAPPYVKLNIETLSIKAGEKEMYFLPDRVLVYDRKNVGGVSYSELSVKVDAARFIENGAAPRDAQVIGKTWQYVNKNGGPDRRFKDNKELPICLYDEIFLRSATGLNEIIQVSRRGVGDVFAEGLNKMRAAMPNNESGHG